METHIKAVGLMNLGLGLLGFAVALAYLHFQGGWAAILGIDPNSSAPFNYRSLPQETVIELAILGYFLAISPLLAIAGTGLFWFQSWARVLCIVASALNMLNIPIGTAVGAYSIWTLLSSEAEPLFEHGEARW